MVQKDRFGICLTFYAVLAFVLALLGQTLLCGLLLGFVLLIHGNEWLTRQTMQAFFLCFVSSIVASVADVFSVFYAIPLLGSVISGVFGFISGILSLVVLVLAIVALVRVAKGQEANLPLLNSLANKAFGLKRITQYYAPAQPASAPAPTAPAPAQADAPVQKADAPDGDKQV